MSHLTRLVFASCAFLFMVAQLSAESAIAVLGKDYVFPHKVEGLPAKLSDFNDLQINFFKTTDGVRLAYWEAGSGEPLIFVPAWSASGANYINVIYLLSKHYHVYVLDERNQGLSQKTENGNRIHRYAMDLREFNQHIGVTSAYYCGWSMGVSVLYGYIDLFGTEGIAKLALIDEPPSILSRPGMMRQELLEAGAIAGSIEGVAAVMSAHTGTSLTDRYNAMDALPYANSESFARDMVPVDTKTVGRIMYDHASIDWRDVIRTRINVPTAIFTGEYSANLPSQRWMKSAIPESTLYIYAKSEQGDHFLALKNPLKFAADMRSFLKDDGDQNSHAQILNKPRVRELLRASASWNNAQYGPYPQGLAEPVMVQIVLPPHTTMPWHRHPMPNFAYLLSGEVTVEDKQGNKVHYVAGQVMPEEVNTFHRGITGDCAVTFLVFYAGVKGMPLSELAQ